MVYTNINLTNHLGSAKFSVDVTEILDLETTFKFYRGENPPPRADGTVPKKNDYEFIVSLALEIGKKKKGSDPFLKALIQPVKAE